MYVLIVANRGWMEAVHVSWEAVEGGGGVDLCRLHVNLLIRSYSARPGNGRRGLCVHV